MRYGALISKEVRQQKQAAEGIRRLLKEGTKGGGVKGRNNAVLTKGFTNDSIVSDALRDRNYNSMYLASARATKVED